ncbi:PAS domain-containing sensor histidine kinase [Methylobacterium nodulans]|uniref:histidine kinase n=1 Tax=Methylobacterium nodulans (strain LMG 21967 / CNCM I-2342 / ORS 2060) TaxID=460265 RepID=B8IF33_METNO|nr:PAS domain-containing sensor histidine kinase [Methylobacterium nodulans]ACL55744.1 PAS/PAC sensor signal transduction histidine kinase [Methylobacterium nodulans ORS 2060]
MRINKAFATLIDARLAGLVHDSVSEESGERRRHERFLISRLATGAVTMAMLPPYLLWRGVPSLIEAAVVACLLLPVVAAFALVRTGRLTMAHSLSSAAHTGLVVCLAHLSGGPTSAASLWLVMIPIEALMAGTHRAAIQAAGFAAAGAVAIAVMEPASEPALGWSAAVAMPIFAITAICHVLSLAIEYRRREGSWSDRLRAASARNALLLDVVDDLVTWHDRNGGVLQASRGAIRLAGASPQSLLGRGLLGRVHVSDRPAFLKAISDAASLDGPVTVQFRLHADLPASGEPGRVIWAEMRAHRVPAGAGAVPGQAAVVAVTRDVSEHHRHAAELDRARAEAERADAVKSRFLAVVSHELRTPLNAIIGFSEMLSAEAGLTLPVERQREYAVIIQSSGRHLLEVVNALLDLTRIQSGSFDFAPEPFDIRAVVNGCCDLMQLRADQVGVELLRDVPRDLPELTADPRACRQMLINLLSNAVKFTPRGGRVTVSVRQAYDRIELSVTDTGIGIAEADLPRLGDPFFQAGDAAAYARMHEGTGLGLSVVRGLVGLHDGEMTLESSVARGTRVVVALPLDCRGGPRPGLPVPIRTAPLAEPAALPLLRAG